jgi:hypothetical protein
MARERGGDDGTRSSVGPFLGATPVMNDLERLIAIDKIKMLKARYFRVLDSKDLDLLRSVCTDDVVLDFRGTAADPRAGVNVPTGSTIECRGGAERCRDLSSCIPPSQLDSYWTYAGN